MNKKNDWIAINLNSGEDVSLDSLSAYGINPDNTGLQSEDYYKSIKQVRDVFTNEDGTFNDSKFHDFYESAKRSYNDYQQSDFTQKIIGEIDSSPYDIFSLGSKVMDTSAAIYRSRDPQRTTMGLGNLFEVGSPTFDVREVAQANKARDEKGNVLDWSPNDKGGLLKGLFRPTMALATYDEDGTHLENGVTVSHKKGDLKLDEYGDPYYEKLGNKEIYGKETLHYWDTITRDDSAWNKIDFMDSDGLTKSIGGTVMRTAFSLLPYFTPIGPYLGYVGATIALGQTLPVFSKALDGILTGNTDDAFGRSMSSLESIMDRFGHSQSRDTMGKFLSFENIGDIIASSAGQLFQQRMISQLPKKFAKSKDVLATSKFGRELALGYMIATSGSDAYSTFKEAGATDRMAGIGLLGVTGGLALLMNNDYFKDILFTGTFMDEDIAMRDTINQLVKESTIEPFQQYAAITPKFTSKYQQKLANTWLYKQIEKNIVNKVKPLLQTLGETRPTVGMLERAAIEEGKNGVSFGMKASMYLNRALNEGLEETMEEGVTDAMKLITIGLDSLGVRVSKPDQELDFGLTLRDALSRYGSAFIGGAIGGAVFEGFNQFEGGSYDSLLEKSLTERLVWYERNGYGQEVRDRINRLYKQGKLGNKNLSSKGSRIKTVDDKEVVIYGQGDEEDNQNLFVYNVINSYLDRLDAAINDNGLFTSDNKIFDQIWKSIRERRNNDDDPEVQLYHFLEDYDTAKAITVEQMGFLNAVRQDADKLSFDILKKADDIEKAKQQIRQREHLTDADSAKEAELFKNSQYIKTLESELKELKQQWQDILDGKRNGYYMGYAKMMVSPTYDALYTNPKALINQNETFIKSGIDNWSKYNYGIEYSSITEDELKKKIESEYDAYNTLMDSTPGSKDEEILQSWKEKSRALYDMHIKFSEKFAPDIISLNEQLKGKISVKPLDFISETFKTFSDNSEIQFAKDAYANFIHNLKAAEKTSDTNIKTHLQFIAIKTFLNEAFPGNENFDTTSEKLKFINLIEDQLVANNIIGLDLSEIKTALFKSVFEPLRDKEHGSELYTQRKNMAHLLLDKIYTELADSLDDEETIKKYIDGLTEEERSLLIDPEDLVQSKEDILSQIESKRRPLLDSATREWSILFDEKLNRLMDAIERDSDNIKELYDDLIKVILDNTKKYREEDVEVTEQDAKKIIDAILGENVVETAINSKIKERQSKFNPVVELLKKFDIYSGGKLYNVIETISNEEEFLSALKNAKEYTISTKSREQELTTALSFLNVVSAILDSSLDGINETINLSNPEIKLAVSDPELAQVYSSSIEQLADRINLLLDISHANKLKTTRAQQETMINMNRIRVKQLVNIGKINFGGVEIDFEKAWNDTNYKLDDFTLDKSKEADAAFNKFEKTISEQFQTIIKEKAKSGTNVIVSDIIKPLVEKLGSGIYLQETGELSDKPDEVIPPYAMATYLLTLGIVDSNNFRSIWKSLCKANPSLIPIYAQEYLVRENMASVIDFKEGFGLFAKLNQYIKDNFPKTKLDDDGKPTHWGTENNDKGYKYLSEREVLENFSNSDGIGGTGKTVGVGYLTNEGLKMYYAGNTSCIAMGATDQAAQGMHNALKLGKDSKNPMTFEDLVELISKDDSGKLVFDFNTCYIKNSQGKHILRRDGKGNVVDKKGNTIDKINVAKLESLFTTKDGLRLIYFDETGLLNKAQVLFLSELTKLHKIFVIGSGDTLQNKAEVDGVSDGIEDCIYHKTPSLTISMRSDKNGMYKNVEVVKTLLRETKHRVESKDPAWGEQKHSEILRGVMNERLAGLSQIRLIFSDKDCSGHQLIKSSSVIDTANKMLDLISQLKEKDGGKHQLAIVVDDKEKQNQYRNTFVDKIDKDVIIIDSKSVQGKEFDYVIVDKKFTSEPHQLYSRIQDLYTMMTRARRGEAIVDDSNIIGNDFYSDPDESASEDVLGGSPEEKAAIYKDYIDWRMSLMEDVPEYNKTSTPPVPAPAPPTPAPSKPTPTPDEVNEPKPVTTPIITGIDDEENVDVENMSIEERIEYYKKRRITKGGYYARLINERDSLKNNGTDSIDFDEFVSKLKDFDDNSFEEQPLSLVADKQLDSEDKKFTHRVIIATIARAILNNDNDDDRKNYINKAGKYLGSKLRRLDLSENIITDLANSFGNDGFFFFNKGLIYYSFNSNNVQYAIPISVHKQESNDGRIFANLTFKKVVGSIPVSSFGEIMNPTGKSINEIDGLVMDESDQEKPQIGVITLNETIRQKIKEHYEKGDSNSPIWRKIARALSFLTNNSGKSFLSFNSLDSKFLLGNEVFEIKKNKNGKYESAISEEYAESITQSLGLVGIQQLTTIEDWYTVMGILSLAVHHSDRSVLTSEKEQILRNFFCLPGENIFGKFNSVVNGDPKAKENIRSNYKVLSEYKVLNPEAVNKLSSAIFRYILAKNPKWSSRYLQGFTKWLKYAQNADIGSDYHRRGFTVQFETKGDVDGVLDTINHTLTVVPKTIKTSNDKGPEIVGYEVLYSSSENPRWVRVYETSDSTPYSLFENTKFDFVTAIHNIIGLEYTDENLKSLLSNIDENTLTTGINSGKIIIYPVDLMYSGAEDVGLPQKVWSPYETDVYEWMSKSEDGSNELLSADELQDLHNFLLSDTTFKNNMYRNIRAIHPDTEEVGWGRAQGVNLANSYIDIIKLIAPLYQFNPTIPVKLNSERETELRSKLNGFFERQESPDSNNPYIEKDGYVGSISYDRKTNDLLFDDGPIEVNAAWLRLYTTSFTQTQGIFKISGYDILNKSIIVDGIGKFILNQEGYKNFISVVPDLQKEIDKRITQGRNGEIILGKSININGTIYDNITLIGINGDKYTFKNGDVLLHIMIDKDKLKWDSLNIRNIESRGKFLGILNDSIQSFAIYVSGDKMYLRELNDYDNSKPSEISMDQISITDTAVSIAGMPVSDPELIQELKNHVNNVSIPNFDSLKSFETSSGNIRIVIGSHSISAAQLQRLINPSTTLDPNGNYHILAFDSERVGYYFGDDLSTFAWGEIKEFDPKTIKEGGNDYDFKWVDENNPAKSLIEEIARIKEAAIKQFSEPNSTEDSFKYSELKNGEIVEVTETDFVDDSTVSVKQKRAIYNWLPNDVSDVSIYRHKGETQDSPIMVSYKINGVEVIDKIRMLSDFSIVKISNQKVSDFDTAKGNFDDVLISLQEQNQQLNQNLSMPLSIDEAKMMQEQLNIVTNTLAIMSDLNSEFDKKEKMNTSKILSLIKKLDKQTASIALAYYKAIDQQIKCVG